MSDSKKREGSAARAKARREQAKREERARQAMQAWGAIEKETLSIYLVEDEEHAKEVAVKMVDEPAEWKTFRSQEEFENIEFGFDRWMRRLPLETNVFVFLDVAFKDDEMDGWLRSGLFDAITRAHTCGRRLHLAVLARPRQQEAAVLRCVRPAI